MIVFDGKGGLMIKATYNDMPGSMISFVLQKATNNINHDCTGRVISGETHYLDLLASPDGSFCHRHLGPGEYSDEQRR
jgi:hypothetical protein